MKKNSVKLTAIACMLALAFSIFGFSPVYADYTNLDPQHNEVEPNDIAEDANIIPFESTGYGYARGTYGYFGDTDHFVFESMGNNELKFQFSVLGPLSIQKHTNYNIIMYDKTADEDIFFEYIVKDSNGKPQKLVCNFNAVAGHTYVIYVFNDDSQTGGVPSPAIGAQYGIGIWNNK